MKIKVMSRQLAAQASNGISEPFAIISISDFNGIDNRFADNKNLLDVLFLHFDDVDSGSKSITTKDAEAIVDFVNGIKDKAELLIVHCQAGISRSAGVAGGLLKGLTGSDSEIFDNPRYKPNIKCYRSVLNEILKDI